jgi:hypothetical protein
MLCVRFEPTIPALERAKTVHALDREATVIGRNTYTTTNIICVIAQNIVTHRPIARQRLDKHFPTNTRPTIQERCFLWSVLCSLLPSAH